MTSLKPVGKQDDMDSSRNAGETSAATPKSTAPKRRALKLFSKTNKRRCWNIASYHHPDSLTWSWILAVDFDGIWLRWRSRWPRFSAGGYGRNWSVCVPGAALYWHRQDAMWKCASVAKEHSSPPSSERSSPGRTPQTQTGDTSHDQ